MNNAIGIVNRYVFYTFFVYMMASPKWWKYFGRSLKSPTLHRLLCPFAAGILLGSELKPFFQKSLYARTERYSFYVHFSTVLVKLFIKFYNLKSTNRAKINPAPKINKITVYPLLNY